MERLLLVELAAIDRFHRGVLFPYLLGFAREHGVPARWLRFAVRAAVGYDQGSRGADLPEADRRRLAAVIEEHAPSRVVLSAWPGRALREWLRAQAPHAELALLGAPRAESQAAPASEVPPLAGDSAAWCAFLGIPVSLARPDSRPLSALVPDFGFEPACEAAAAMQPLPYLLLGEECTYNRPLAKVAAFQGLDLSDCVRQGGCSFCSRPAAQGTPRAFSVADLRRQAEALRRTLPPFPGRLSLRLAGEPAFWNIGDIVEVLLEVGIDHADVLIDGRPDQIVRRAESLESAARALVGSGLRLHMSLVGIENFARAELERMNKGTDGVTNLDTIRTLLALERDLPETFHFSSHRGLSVILFTPWTTLEDVQLNLRIVHACRIEGLFGKLLTARLRLEPGLPLTALARTDGLLAQGYRDPAFDTAARNLYGEEFPWCFRDPRLEPLCSLLIRLSTDTDFGDEPLARAVERARSAAMRSGHSELELALALTEQAGRPDLAGVSAEGLLESVAETVGSDAVVADAATSFAWLQLARRVASPGPVPPQTNPWIGLLRGRPGSPAEGLADPWLVLLRGEGSALQLRPKDPPGPRFRVEAGASVGEAPELPLLREVDELRLDGERLLALRDGRLLADLSGYAWLWWHERAFQADWWRRVLAIRALAPAEGVPEKASTVEEAPAGVSDDDRIEPGLERLRRVLQKVLDDVAFQRRAAVVPPEARLEAQGPSRLRLLLGAGERPTELLVSPADAAESHLFRVGPFAFAHPREQPLDTPARRSAVRDLARYLKSWFAARGR